MQKVGVRSGKNTNFHLQMKYEVESYLIIVMVDVLKNGTAKLTIPLKISLSIAFLTEFKICF